MIPKKCASDSEHWLRPVTVCRRQHSDNKGRKPSPRPSYVKHTYVRRHGINLL